MEEVKVTEVEEVEKEGFFKKVKRKVAEKTDKALCFLADNPQVTLPLLSGVGMLIGGGTKMILNAGNRKLDHCRVEDDVTGADYLTEHPLTNDEILELNRRMSFGQPKGEALKEMGLLRKEKRRK